ncbi:TetR/AcrR family transcriptional regulator [Streptomyces sp. A7024]|uniref:TetR/AcrR family transcriptional regulator n=1 Tax=Streptomyces coryli TaxID=1128680 RepID=A0A6G4U7P7_9ACTN|nr:TetR/AcrR family transcriptional regulator [Streptomyces coryli]NGN67736.1 TetR/AcrR family transcriptional regulator [Streptomyces coryli]
MPALQGARERARAEVTSAIKEEARRRLAEEGAAKLSLRAVARELGMVSSALYRYFPSRDDLLTALIIDAYNSLGEAAERARTTAPAGHPVARWLAVCRAIRAWARAHPHEYALIYGSPVPGYQAPQDTTAPASRTALALLAVLQEAGEEGLLAEPPASAPAVAQDVERLLERLDIELSVSATAAFAAAWAQLFGLVSFELFGQYDGVIEARDEFFDQAAAGLARAIGLRVHDAPAA